MNSAEAAIEKLLHSLISPGSVFSLPQLAVAFAIAFAFLAARQFRRRGAVPVWAILRAMARRRLFFHPSTRADLFYYFSNTFAFGALIGWGLFSSAAVAVLALRTLDATFGACALSSAPDWALRAAVTVLAFLAYELGYYIDHYLKHKIPLLWEFHKVHHSAEVLTPLTVFRVHPIDSLIFTDIVATTIGLTQGIFCYGAGRNADPYVIGATNAIMVVFFFLVNHLQHSQFWIPLTGLPGRILLSPAHHQIHHALDPAYHDRNFGSFLAIWDWLFGTLRLPEIRPERFKFGVSQAAEAPHSITALLVEPFIGAWAALGIARRGARRVQV